MWTDLPSVLSQCTRVTDRWTDRQTYRILIAIPRLHYMQRGKNQSIWGAHKTSSKVNPVRMIGSEIRIPNSDTDDFRDIMRLLCQRYTNDKTFIKIRSVSSKSVSQIV